MCGKRGEDTAPKETGQLHDEACFKPVQIEDMTPYTQTKDSIYKALNDSIDDPSLKVYPKHEV